MPHGEAKVAGFVHGMFPDCIGKPPKKSTSSFCRGEARTSDHFREVPGPLYFLKPILILNVEGLLDSLSPSSSETKSPVCPKLFPQGLFPCH